MPKKQSDNGKINPDPIQEPTPTNTLIVGIGASAGGVAALKEFFENVPTDSGNIYVVILHLSPEFESQLAEVLQHSSRIPVRQVSDERIKVEPDCVYVIPPDRNLTMDDGHLSTSHVISNEQRRAPVDIFFRSLAETKGDRAVSVILTGTGPDGSMGIKRVKEKGGIIIVQDPEQAEYSDMPHNAIRTGLVDYVLPIAEIPTKINDYKNRLGTVEIDVESDDDSVDSDENALQQIFLRLRVRTGHDFSGYKRATILRRIERRMNVHGLSDLQEYAKFLHENNKEPEALLKDLLISVTNFFRDAQAFEFLEKEIIAKILAEKTVKDVVRIWVTGCATGEEAYSIAMLFAEMTNARLDPPVVQIFATDIDESAIARARSALYTSADVADVSPERLSLFFHKEGENYRVRREIRETVLFAVHNVTKDPPFSRLDLATCRNLLIYLNRTAQARVMDTLHFALNAGGYLFLGSSESVDTPSDIFVPINKEFRIYQSRSVGARISVPTPELSPNFLNANFRSAADRGERADARTLERLSYAALHQQLLEQYAAPSVVVNEDYDILHISEHAGRFMQFAGGELSKNLLSVARPELRLELRTALYQAVQQRTAVTVPGIQVKTEDKLETVDIIVRPVVGQEDPNRGFILVIFSPPTDDTADIRAIKLDESEPIARQLEAELVHTKSQLRSTIEQYEVQHEELKASNEELQAINEELRSSAEELETSKEELQSVNEELTTVNQELKIKIEELSQSNNDFHNLINSTDVGTIFLDRGLRVKLFTDAATGIFNLIPADIGRPLSDLKSTIKSTDLTSDARKVLADLLPMEKEVEDNSGIWYVMRALPYRTSDDRIEGVILTFLDITRRKHDEEQLRESHDRLNEVIDTIGDAFYAIDGNDNFIFVNRKAEEWLDKPHGSLIGKNIWEELPESYATFARECHVQAREENRPVHFESNKPVEGVWLDISIFPDSRGGLSCYLRDETEKRRREESSRLQAEQLGMLLARATEYAIFTADKNGLVTSWNKGAEYTFGYTEREMMGKTAEIIFTVEDRRRGEPRREMMTALETGRAEDERWHLRKNGSIFFATGVMQTLREDGEIVGFVKICRDQTEKIEAETAIRERQILHRLVTTQEDERKRIARDLHDHLGQQLTGLRLKLEGLKTNHSVEPAMIKALDETQELAFQIDKDVTFLTWELRPTVLDNLGLRNALANFVVEWSKNYDIPAEFHTARLKKTRLAPDVEIGLYRIAQEALNNIVKHAKAKKAEVMLEFGKEDVVLMIEDNGVGFDQASADRSKTKGQGRLGIVGMRERAALLGGTLEIESARLRGTTIIARVPARYAEQPKRTTKTSEEK